MNVSSLNPTAAPAAAATRALQRKWLVEYSMPLGYVVLFAVLAATVENFFSVANVVGLMLSVAQIGMVACTIFRDGRKIVTHPVMAEVPRKALSWT